MDRQALWNWTKAALGLRHVRNALQTLVVNHVKTFYDDLQCRQPKRICQCNQKTVAKPIRKNQCPTCPEIYKRLIAETINGIPMISNCKVENWRTNEWEVAKAFIPGVGYKDIDSADGTDVSGMISICLNATFIRKELIQSDLDAFNKVRDIRNKVFHSSTMEISIEDFQVYIQTMLDMLDDHLAKSEDDIWKAFQTAKEALDKLPQEPLCEHCLEQIDCNKDALVALNVDATQLIDKLEQPQPDADTLQTQEKLAAIFKTQNVHSTRIDCQEQKMDKTMHTLSSIPIHQKETVKIRAQIKDSLAKQGIAMQPTLCEALKHDVKIFQPKQLFQIAPTKQDDQDKDELILEKLKDIQQAQNEMKLEMLNLKEAVNDIQNKNQEATDDNLKIHQDDNDPNYGSNSNTDIQTSNASYDPINDTAFPKPESHEADTDKARPDKDIDNNSNETVSDQPGSDVDIARTENDTEKNPIGTEADSNGEDSDQAEIHPGDDDINVLAGSMTGIMYNVSDLPGNDVDKARTENDTQNNPSGTESDTIGEDSDKTEIHPGDDDINVLAGSVTEIMSNDNSSTNMDSVITQYVLPRDVLPRYNYTAKHVYRLDKRCQRLIRKSGLSDPKVIQKFNKVYLNIESKTDETVLNEDELVRTPGQHPLERRQLTVTEFAQAKETSTIDASVPVVFVASSTSVKADLPEYFESLTLLLSHPSEINDVNRFSRDIIRTSRDNFAKELNNILEYHVFNSIKARIDVLKYLLKASNLDEPQRVESPVGDRSARQKGEYARTLLRKYELTQESEAKQELRPTYKTLPHRKYSVDQLCNHMNENILTDLDDSLASIQLRGSSPRGCSDASLIKLRKHLEIVRGEGFKQEVKDLLAEITAHYMRSNIPDTLWACHSQLPVSMKEEILRKIFTEVKDITSCFYRLDTLHVVVDERTKLTKAETEENVRRILRDEREDEHFILRYSSETSTELFHATVGGTLVVRGGPDYKHGTVGGFARRNNTLYALTARHVAECSEPDVKIESCVNEEIVTLGRHLIPPENFPRMPCDIAAIRVDVAVENDCSVRLKNEHGGEMHGHLYNSETGQIKSIVALPVYIWGAKSKPGKGIITTPERYMSAPPIRLKYIDVEDCSDDDDSDSDTDTPAATGADRHTEQPFARKGDSGSIVCYVDPDGENLYAISMFSGVRCDKSKKGEDGEKRTSYFTFSLRQGFTQLKLEQCGNTEFELC